MTKLLRIPNEPRFVRAFALVVDPGDTLSLLLEIGALGSRDLSLVRRTREALDPAYERASDLKDWDQTHAISVLREALAQSDSAAYLAYQVRNHHRAAHSATEYAEALAIVGYAADTLCAALAGRGRSSQMTFYCPSGDSESSSDYLPHQAMPCLNPQP